MFTQNKTAAAQSTEAATPSVGLRIGFLVMAITVVLVAHAPIVALAARVVA